MCYIALRCTMFHWSSVHCILFRFVSSCCDSWQFVCIMFMHYVGLHSNGFHQVSFDGMRWHFMGWRRMASGHDCKYLGAQKHEHCCRKQHAELVITAFHLPALGCDVFWCIVWRHFPQHRVPGRCRAFHGLSWRCTMCLTAWLHAVAAFVAGVAVIGRGGLKPARPCSGRGLSCCAWDDCYGCGCVCSFSLWRRFSLKSFAAGGIVVDVIVFRLFCGWGDCA